MSAHKSWRLTFAGSNDGTFVQLTEVTFLDQAGADVSVGGTAGASSVFSGAYAAANAFDKSLSTDWSTAANDFPARLWYTRTTAVDVRTVRIRCGTASAYLPRSMADIGVSTSDDGGVTWTGSFVYGAVLTSGSIAGGAQFEFSVIDIDPANLALLQPLPGFVQGRAAVPYSGHHLAPLPSSLRQDFRQQGVTTGVITDRVMFKATPSSPESPFAQGRVWLLRLADGYKAWEGWSNQAGYYTATGLELGVDYIAVGIDPLRNHKATGAGPVRAVEAV